MNSISAATKTTTNGTATTVEDSKGTRVTRDVDADNLLPEPFVAAPTDDLMTTLTLALLKQKHEDRIISDAQVRTAAKAQEDAHARKISKMHELADDTFAEGIVEGITEGLSAVATGVAASLRFNGEMKEIDVKQVQQAAPSIDMNRVARAGQGLIRDASFVDAGGSGLKAAGKFVSSAYKRSQEIDRADIAVIDQEIDRAKGSVDAASTQSRRDQDDIRDTISAFRAFINSKTQFEQSAIFRG